MIFIGLPGLSLHKDCASLILLWEGWNSPTLPCQGRTPTLASTIWSHPLSPSPAGCPWVGLFRQRSASGIWSSYWGNCVIAETDIESKVENEIAFIFKANNVREGDGSKTGNVEGAAQPLGTCTSQDRKVQTGKSKLATQITTSHNICMQNIQFGVLQ